MRSIDHRFVKKESPFFQGAAPAPPYTGVASHGKHRFMDAGIRAGIAYAQRRKQPVPIDDRMVVAGGSTMRGSNQDLPVAFDIPEGTIRLAEWGAMNVEMGTCRAEIDPSPFFAGLRDDRCQCPHWGYVIKGQMRFRYADREEVYRAGDAYYAPPGHTPLLEAGCEYVEFSPVEEYRATTVVVKRNMAAMQSGETGSDSR